MAYRTIERTKVRLAKRIKRIEDKQKKLIDRLTFDPPENKKKQFWIKWQIHHLSKVITKMKDRIASGTYRQSRGAN